MVDVCQSVTSRSTVKRAADAERENAREDWVRRDAGRHQLRFLRTVALLVVAARGFGRDVSIGHV